MLEIGRQNRPNLYALVPERPAPLVPREWRFELPERVTARGEATVGVVELDAKHAFANIALTDNVVRFATARYNKNPLIVQGPGAGPEVTAGGVFADLLRLSAYLGARL